MQKIAIDMMGNDNGVKPIVDAVVEFSKKNLDYTFILVGDKSLINRHIKETERAVIIDSKKIVDKNKGIREARKLDSSMATTINLLKDKEVDAIISSGDSGIYLGLTTLSLKRMPGIKRPAFMPIFPTIIKNQKFVMMDVGANIESTSEMLVQWAKIGSVFSKNVLKIMKPKVAIINVGTEKNKGTAMHAEAYAALEKDKSINFKGFIEPRDLLYGTVDVVVSDGYAGNMILKSMEGSMLGVLKLLKSSLKLKLKYKIGALLSKGAYKNVSNILDYRNVGAAWVIGLDGIVIKCHGSSDKKSYLGAFNQVAKALEGNALNKIKENFNDK